MALLYFDGFDHYSTHNTSLATYGQGAYAIGGEVPTIYNMPSLGGLGLRLRSNFATATHSATRSIPNFSSGTLGVGFHFYPEGTSAFDSYRLVSFIESISGTAIWRIVFSSLTGIISIYKSGSLVISASSALSNDVLYHIEIKLTLAGAGSDSVEVRVNGVPLVAATAQTDGGNIYNNIGFVRNQTGTGGSWVDIDNLYIWDGTGSKNNDWLGERNVLTTFPNADTAQADWTLSTGSDGYDLVNDIPPVGGTNYLEADSVGQQSTFEMAALPASNVAVTAVQTNVCGQKTDAGSGAIEFGIISNSAPDTSPAAQLTQSQFLQQTYISETNPDTGLDWLPIEVNNLQTTIIRNT